MRATMANGIAEAAPVPAAASAGAAPSRTWRTEDWVAVFLGFLVVLGTLLLFNTKAIDLGQVAPSFRWTTDQQLASRAPAWVAALQNVPAATPLRQALQGNDRKGIEKDAAQLAEVAGAQH